MATISVRFVVGAATTTGAVTVSDANAGRILAAEKTLLGTSADQDTVDKIARRLVDEMIGNTKTIERNANAVADIPVT